ncbi:MAG: TetR family transcriptional regulator [Geodermatophilaceae bacterium]
MAFTERSQPARKAILAAARRRFTRDGYERTTIRAVAADAGVDPAMVMRYYQSKEGLFGAAVDIDLHLPDLTDVPLDEISGLLARHFVNRWEGDLADEAIMVMLRSSVTNPKAAERLRSVFGLQVVSLVRAATQNSPDSELRAGMISTQLLGLALSRYILRLPPVAALDPETLIKILTPMLARFLTGTAVPGPEEGCWTHRPSP